MNCIRNNLCYQNTLFCCYSCEVMRCETKNDCNDDECEKHPNYGIKDNCNDIREGNVTISLKEYKELKNFKFMYEGLIK